MGSIFSGELKEFGPGSDVTYQVHGSMSADGAWVESMFYSREIVRPDVNNRDFFRITLRNIPLAESLNEKQDTIIGCKKIGSDVQRCLVKIEYASEPLVGTKNPSLLSSFKYISTDWKNTIDKPVFKLAFAAGPGTQATDGASVRIPSMGMGG